MTVGTLEDVVKKQLEDQKADTEVEKESYKEVKEVTRDPAKVRDEKPEPAKEAEKGEAGKKDKVDTKIQYE